MQTSVTFKNLDPSDHLKTYVQGKLDRFDKYLGNPVEANVVLAVEKFRHIAEICLSGDRLNIVGKEETDDMYSAIDMVLDKIDKQIKKNKEKFRERRVGARGGKAERINAFSGGAMVEDFDDDGRKVVVEPIDYKPMDVEEAVMQMDLVSQAFMVFLNARTERVNVLYRRGDGNYGLIQPSN